MTPFDRAILFECPAFRVIVHVDSENIIVNNWSTETRYFMHKHLDVLRAWFGENHPGFMETDVTGV